MMDARTIADRALLLREQLAPRPDADLLDAARDARARLDPAYRRELEAEHAYDRADHSQADERKARGLTGRMRQGGLAMEEKPRCQWCRRPIANENADCRACGHRQDLSRMYSTGGR